MEPTASARLRNTSVQPRNPAQSPAIQTYAQRYMSTGWSIQPRPAITDVASQTSFRVREPESDTSLHAGWNAYRSS